MKDTIGAHMAEAAFHHREVGKLLTVRLTRQNIANVQQSLAIHRGAAAGHTIRALELAYDLKEEQVMGRLPDLVDRWKAKADAVIAAAIRANGWDE